MLSTVALVHQVVLFFTLIVKIQDLYKITCIMLSNYFYFTAEVPNLF